MGGHERVSQEGKKKVPTSIHHQRRSTCVRPCEVFRRRRLRGLPRGGVRQSVQSPSRLSSRWSPRPNATSRPSEILAQWLHTLHRHQPRLPNVSGQRRYARPSAARRLPEVRHVHRQEDVSLRQPQRPILPMSIAICPDSFATGQTQDTPIDARAHRPAHRGPLWWLLIYHVRVFKPISTGNFESFFSLSALPHQRISNHVCPTSYRVIGPWPPHRRRGPLCAH
jgi:hypothetical protein